MKYQIVNTLSGHDFGTFDADTEMEALEALARDAGYASHEEAQQVAPISPGELLVRPT